MYFTEIFTDFMLNITAHNSKYRDFQNIYYIMSSQLKELQSAEHVTKLLLGMELYKQMACDKIMALK